MATNLALSAAACRDARNLLRLTQDEVAQVAGISVSTVRRCERGETISDYARRQIVTALEEQGATFVGVSRKLRHGLTEPSR